MERFGFGLEIASTAQILTEQMKRWGLLTGTIQPTMLDVVHAGYNTDQSDLNARHLISKYVGRSRETKIADIILRGEKGQL